MTGPHPVVGIATELTDIRWRGTHQADVGEHLVDIHKILVAIVERLDDSLIVRTRLGTLGDGLYVLFNDGAAFSLAGLGRNAVKHLRRDILHPHQSRCRKSRAGQLLFAAHSPESASQIVVLHSAMHSDVRVAAVVVGEEKALAAHILARAALVEKQYSVLQTGIVNVINVLCRNAHSSLLHIGLVAAQQHRNPHTLISQRADCHCRHSKQHHYFLHNRGVYIFCKSTKIS